MSSSIFTVVTRTQHCQTKATPRGDARSRPLSGVMGCLLKGERPHLQGTACGVCAGLVGWGPRFPGPSEVPEVPPGSGEACTCAAQPGT